MPAYVAISDGTSWRTIVPAITINLSTHGSLLSTCNEAKELMCIVSLFSEGKCR